MSTTTKAPVGSVSPWFRQAIEMYQTAVKAGLHFQEESTRRLTDMFAEFTPPQDWRKASQEFLDEMIQASQTSFDESIRAMTQSTRSGMELLQKAMESVPSGSIEESQAKVRELAEATLHAMRTNAQAAIQANSQMVEAWAEFAKRMAGERCDRDNP